jgi:hypothetical protein
MTGGRSSRRWRVDDEPQSSHALVTSTALEESLNSLPLRLLKLRFVSLAATLFALAAIAPPAGAQGQGGVLVVGDSLEVLTSPYLHHHLPDLRLTINAVGGYNSYQIFDLFQEAYDPSQSVIVFDAGTNDNPQYPEILAGNLRKAAAIAGNRCFVVPTIHGFTVNGYNNEGKNQVVRAFAASRPGTQVPDWATVAVTHPELMQSDHLHPNAEGAAYRAHLIALAVRACLVSAPTAYPSGSGGATRSAVSPLERRLRDRALAVKRRLREHALAARLLTIEILRHLMALTRRDEWPGRLVAAAVLLVPAEPAKAGPPRKRDAEQHSPRRAGESSRAAPKDKGPGAPHRAPAD